MEFAPSEHEPCVRCLQLGFGLCQPDFVGARVDGEEEIALMDDVPILEVYSGKRAADLGAQLNLLDRGKLTKEARSGINLALERLAHDDLRKGRRSRGGCVALTIRIGQPCSRDDGDGYPDSDPEFGLRPSAAARTLFSGPTPIAGFV